MKHFGDITKIDGHKLPVVDVVTGGSPCQDLSVAGKRAGLAGERSGLFMEQIRIIKEMREEYVRVNGSDDMVRPRWMVWENVPGAFSSNGGEDFRAVLEETARVCDPNAVIPRPPGKWTPSGTIMGDGWSIAWRVHDAQFWGVPQRRRRIALVADFGGASAPEILFERKGLSGDTEPGRAPGEGAAEGTEGGADSAICLQGNGIDRSETAGCNGAGWRRGGPTPLTPSTGTACAVDVYNQTVNGDTAAAVTAAVGGANTSGPKVITAGFKQGNGSRAAGVGYEQEKAPTLAAAESGTNQVPAVMACDLRNGREQEVNGTLQAKPGGA